MARFLPYTTWLDWCTIAYLVTERVARHRFGSILDRLDAIAEVEAEHKLRALRKVRHAFVCHTKTDAISAPDYLLGMACEAAKWARSAGLAKTNPLPIAGGDHERCLLH